VPLSTLRWLWRGRSFLTGAAVNAPGHKLMRGFSAAAPVAIGDLLGIPHSAQAQGVSDGVADLIQCVHAIVNEAIEGWALTHSG
jgi:hypothetical protein